MLTVQYYLITMIPSELNKQLRKWEQKSSKLSDLVEAVNRIVVNLPLKQPHDRRVSSELNERTLRYYISEGLLDASSKKGSAAVYSKKHLLQVLVVKALQARYLPIKRIREILWGKSNEELESILRDYVKEQPTSQKGLPHRDYLSEQIPMFEPHTPEEAPWKRLALDDGVELHIRTDRMKALSRSEVERMVDRLLTLLKVKYGR
jgi:DNA-binding transcriptional MerR regulator